MALLTSKYIRLLPQGRYEVYNSAEERELAKKAPSVEEIKKKYHEILFNLKSYFYELMDVPKVALEKYNVVVPEEYTDRLEADYDWKQKSSYFFIEADKYDKEKAVYYHKVLDEKNLFKKSVYNDAVSFEEFKKLDFPIMKEYFPDIALCKIRPTDTGSFCLPIDDIDEVYRVVKERKYFGDTVDV